MLIVGIDPGTAICGFGVVELQGSRLRAVEYGTFQTTKALRSEERLDRVYQGVDALLKQYHPDCMGVEQLFFNRNVTTAIAVGQARGVILLAAAQNHIPLSEFTPLQVKQAVVGYGKATKEQVIFMTQRLLNLTVKPHPDDAADALAIAICAAHAGTSEAWRLGR